MGFSAVAKEEVMKNHAIFVTVGKFAQLTADLIPGVIGQKVQRGTEKEYQHHERDVKAADAIGSLSQPFREVFAGYGRLRGATQDQQAFNGLIWSLCPRYGFQCQL